MSTGTSIATVVLNAGITIIVSLVTINSQLPKMIAETHSIELKNSIEAFKYMDDEINRIQCDKAISDRVNSKIEHLLELYAHGVKVPVSKELHDNYRAILNSEICVEKNKTSSAFNLDYNKTSEQIYVVVGAFNNTSGEYQYFTVHRNSTQAKEHGKVAEVKMNDFIKAKTAVYLRKGNSDIDLGNNTVVGTVGEGDCLKVEEAYPDLRNKTWARVKLLDNCTFN